MDHSSLQHNELIERLRRTEEQLRQSELRLEESQTLAHIGSWEWNIAADRLLWSAEMYRIYGLDPSSFVATYAGYQNQQHPDDRAFVAETVARAMQSGEPYQFEHRIIRPDGTVRWLHGRGQVVLGPDRRPIRIFGTSLDITEQHQAAEERAQRIRAEAILAERREVEAQLRQQSEVVATINRIGSMLTAELDLQRLLQAITDAATEVTGAQFGAFFFNQVDDNGESYTLYTLSGVPREAFARFPLPRNTAIFGPTFRGERPIRLHDVLTDSRYGHSAPYFGMPPGHLPVRSYLAVPVMSRSGEVMGGLFFGHGEPGVFTERAEQVLVGLAAQTAIAMDNARLFLEAQQAIQARDTFLSMAAHELKTPVTTILGFAQLLVHRSERDGQAGTRQGRALKTLLAQVERMERLVRTLLDLSRINLGVFTLERVSLDVAEFVTRLVDPLQPTLEHHSISVHVDSGPHIVEADEVRLEQVVINVLQNAIKYSPAGGPIKIMVARQDETVCLTITDQGIGIPSAALANIFNRFYRASNADTGQVSGMGVGLYVVREIVTLHGGRVEVDSVEGEGTSVRVFLRAGDTSNDIAADEAAISM